MIKKNTDYLNNEYKSLNEKCQAYNITPQLYNERKKLGWSEKEALLGKEKITVYDHEGNTFTSNREKSREHNVAESTYRTRIKAGYSEKEALNGLEKVKDPITGIYYKSYRALCEGIGLSYNTFKDRLKKGMTKEEAVSKNRSK